MRAHPAPPRRGLAQPGCYRRYQFSTPPTTPHALLFAPMAVTASLGQAALTVEPGGTVATDVTLANDDGGAAVTVKLTVTGDGRPFSYIVPDTLTVEAGATATARVGFRV